MLLRPGNAGANTAADHITVIDRSLAQIPADQVETIEILIRADSAGATHETADHCRRADLRFSFGYELTEQVRAAILATPDDVWIPALDQDDTERTNGQVVETDRPRRSQYLADRVAGHRPARASPPRRATVVHRPRRLPLPSDPHRPDRPRHRRPGASPPSTRPRRGPHPRRQGHRPGQAPVQGVRTQRGVAADRHARPRPDRLDPSPLPRRRARPAGTVVEVLQPAYGEGDLQLRPALVVVAKGE